MVHNVCRSKAFALVLFIWILDDPLGSFCKCIAGGFPFQSRGFRGQGVLPAAAHRGGCKVFAERPRVSNRCGLPYHSGPVCILPLACLFFAVLVSPVPCLLARVVYRASYPCGSKSERESVCFFMLMFLHAKLEAQNPKPHAPTGIREQHRSPTTNSVSQISRGIFCKWQPHLSCVPSLQTRKPVTREAMVRSAVDAQSLSQTSQARDQCKFKTQGRMICIEI